MSRESTSQNFDFFVQSEVVVRLSPSKDKFFAPLQDGGRNRAVINDRAAVVVLLFSRY